MTPDDVETAMAYLTDTWPAQRTFGATELDQWRKVLFDRDLATSIDTMHRLQVTTHARWRPDVGVFVEAYRVTLRKGASNPADEPLPPTLAPDVVAERFAEIRAQLRRSHQQRPERTNA